MVKFNKHERKAFLIILVLFYLIFNSFFVLSQPELPLEVYGTARLFNMPVSPGTTIRAFDINSSICGQFVVQNTGFFGTISCFSKGTFDNEIGGSEGDVMRFRIGNFPASVLLDNSSETLNNIYEEQNKLTWSSGEFKEIILVAPPIVCGDAFCDDFESCSTCPEDCGECPQPPPSQPTPTQPDFGSGFPEDFGPEAPGLPEDEVIEEDEECIESWSCSEWGPCLPSGVQYRECVDLNECGTQEDKPENQQTCIYEEREVTDPIDRERPRIEAPVEIEICDSRLPILGIESLVFFVLFALIIIIPLIYLDQKKKTIRKQKLEEVDELVEIYHFEKRIYNFLIIATVLSIIIYLYHYFFFLCPDVYYNNLWLLVIFVLISPILINVLISLRKYSEKNKLLKMKLLSDNHYKHLDYLIKMYNKELLKSEVEITNKIYTLNNKDEFSDLLAETKEIKQIYKDLLKLFSLYSEDKDSLKIEKDLLEQINSLENNEEFNKASDDYPELAILRNNISLLYEAYGYKKELLDELKATEEKINEEEKQKEEKDKLDRKEEQKETETYEGEEEQNKGNKFFGELKEKYADLKTKEKEEVEKEEPNKTEPKESESRPEVSSNVDFFKQKKYLMDKLNLEISKKEFIESVKIYRELKRLYLKRVFKEEEQILFKKTLFEYYSTLKDLKTEIEQKLGKG